MELEDYEVNEQSRFPLLGTSQKAISIQLFSIFLVKSPTPAPFLVPKDPEWKVCTLVRSFLGTFRWYFNLFEGLRYLGNLVLFECFHALIPSKCLRYRKMPLVRNVESVFIFLCPTFCLEMFCSHNDKTKKEA
jgi:hypothetical protein